MGDATTQISDSIDFPLAEIDRAIADLIPGISGPAKWRAFNAIRHLNWAWKLRTIDPEMAVFRGITAEEEAATAIFVALRRRSYDGSEKLRPRDHVHKNAVIPFFDAITRVLTKFAYYLPEAQLFLNTDEKPPLLTFRFRRPHPETGEPAWAYSDPPLNFSATQIAPDGARRAEDFAAGVNEIASGAKVKDILAYIRDRANQRNRVLYAGDGGYLALSGDVEKEIQRYKRNVFTLLRIYLLIDLYSAKQLFIQQALTAFLRTLRLLPDDVDAESSP